MLEDLFFDRARTVTETGQKLPHWDQGEKLYHVTLRLNDSLPQAILSKYQQARRAFISAHSGQWDGQTKEQYFKEFRTKLDRYLDAGYGSCLLASPQAAEIVESALLQSQRADYTVIAYAIAANHVHILFALSPDLPLPALIRRWKGYTSHAINALTQRKGPLWQREYYDTIIRNDQHYRAVLAYILRHIGRTRRL